MLKPVSWDNQVMVRFLDHSTRKIWSVVMTKLNDYIVETLRKFRQGAVDITSFQQWVDGNRYALAAEVSSGVLLKFHRGNTQKVMGAIAGILPSCTSCDRIGPSGDFYSRLEHAKVAEEVDTALRVGILKRIPRPSWVNTNSQHLGADAYFQCVNCGSIWTLVEPEQHDNGSWRRLA